MVGTCEIFCYVLWDIPLIKLLNQMLFYCYKYSCAFCSYCLLFPFLCVCLSCLNFSLCVLSYLDWVCNSFRIDIVMLWLLFQIFTNISYQSWCRIHLLGALYWWTVIVSSLSPYQQHFDCNWVLPFLCIISPANSYVIHKYFLFHSPMYACLVSTTNIIWILF